MPTSHPLCLKEAAMIESAASGRPIASEPGHAGSLIYTRYLPLGEYDQLLPLVLVHGASHTRSIYHAWAIELADHGIPVYTLDLRGHGDSPMPDGGVVTTARFADYVEDIRTLVLDRDALLGSGNFVLLGHSMGGAIVQLYARQYPVAGLIVLSAPTPHRLLTMPWRAFVTTPFLLLHAVRQGTRSLFASPSRVRALLLEPDADQATVDLVLHQIGDETARFLADGRQLRRLGPRPLQTDRVLFLSGSADRCVLPEMVQRCARELGTEAILIPEGPHDLMVAKAPASQAARAEIVRFVASCHTRVPVAACAV
jgi:pimeloyl-ACP methyl ester carboxylesterase